ncbi:MAG: hypothetical protein ACJ8FS_02010 [Sphingomicrobium sp.]
MKHDQGMLKKRELTVRTESPFVRSLHMILMYWAKILRLARSSQTAQLRKDTCMVDHDEIPTDDEVLDAIRSTAEGLTPTALMDALEASGHTQDNIIRAIQRVLDRNKVCLADGARLVPTRVKEPAFA